MHLLPTTNIHKRISKLKADYILSAANQFNIGSYVSRFPLIFKGMTGTDVNLNVEQRMNQDFAEIVKTLDSRTKLHILYSTEEPTFENDTKDMLLFLKESNIPYTASVIHYKQHGETGAHFKPWAKNILTDICDMDWNILPQYDKLNRRSPVKSLQT